MRNRSLVPCALAVMGLLTLRAQEVKEGAESEQLTDLLGLLNTPVISASRSAEKLSEAPATVIVISRDDIRARGYYQLSQILDDLPGMQAVRSNGDYYVKDYWRGYRSTQGDPFLLMVDGRPMNSLFYNAVEWAFVTMPLSNVERIEVVYGPASALYGSNAFMGVINVITAAEATGPSNDAGRAEIVTGSDGLRVVDASFVKQEGDFRFSATARFEYSLLDADQGQAYDYSNNRYYTDSGIWGVLADGSSGMGGPSRSVTDAKALDIRAQWGSTEIGLTYHCLKTGYGNEYAADKSPNNQLWGRDFLSLWLKQTAQLSSNLGSTTTVTYLDTGITPDSYYLENNSWSLGAAPMGMDFQYYLVDNTSWTVNQDFEYKPFPQLAVNFGLKLDEKNQQKGYVTTPDYVGTVVTFNPANPDFPSPLSSTNDPRYRILTEDRAAYLQARWHFAEGQSLILGGRVDGNSIYGTAPTVRMGYVGNFGGWTAKALYGQAYNEPTMVNLYSSFSASQANENLVPEKSNTTEVSVGYTQKNVSSLFSLWSVHNTDTIVDKQNLGEQEFDGFDLHLQYLAQPSWARKVSLWGYVSDIFRNHGANHLDTTTGKVPTTGLTANGEQVGDISKTQLKAGATVETPGDACFTLLARHVSAIDTVASNPLGSVPSYTTADFIADWKTAFGIKGLGLSFKVSNLTNKLYFEPGIDDANAGKTPGVWQNGVWSHLSGGWYSSLLTQPGRAYQATLRLTF